MEYGSDRVKILLDTDMLTDCDDAAALAMLHVLADRGEVEILATVVSSRHPLSAPVVDTINTYYGRPTLKVGAPKNGAGAYKDNSSFLQQVAAEFPHRIETNADAPDAVEVYREVLAKAEPGQVKIVTIGYMSNLENLLKSGPDAFSDLDGIGLVREKVSEWVCMGGNFPVDPAEDNVNFTRDADAALYSIRKWPGRITFVGREIGHNIHVGEALKQTPISSPVRRAYQLHRERVQAHWNHHTAEPCTVLYAVRGLRDYWAMSPDGRLNLRDDCSFAWTDDPEGNQRYVLEKMDRSQLGELMEMLMAQPPRVK
jgi:inosine-uridine nucleoside N-ribohydrolase